MFTLSAVEIVPFVEDQPVPVAQAKKMPKKCMQAKPKAKLQAWLQKQRERMDERRKHFDSTKWPSDHDAKFLYGREDVLENFFEADLKRFGAGKQGLRQLASRVHESTCYVEGRPVQVTKMGQHHEITCEFHSERTFLCFGTTFLLVAL